MNRGRTRHAVLTAVVILILTGVRAVPASAQVTIPCRAR